MASNKKEVTERDFRQPQFIDANPADYEFRDDGAVVRKDRWETGIRKLASSLGRSRGDWEIDDLVGEATEIIGRTPHTSLWTDRIDVIAESLPKKLAKELRELLGVPTDE